MKKFVSVLLAFTLTFTSVLPCWSQTTDATHSGPATSGHTDCKEHGRVDGNQTSTGGAFSVGLVSGLGLGLIGTAVALGLQGKPEPPAANVEKLENPECRINYGKAYSQQGVAKKRRSVLVGGLIGTAVIVAIAASQQGSTGQ